MEAVYIIHNYLDPVFREARRYTTYLNGTKKIRH
jgi:hypothetical protein